MSEEEYLEFQNLDSMEVFENENELLNKLSIYSVDELATAIDIISKVDNSDSTLDLRTSIDNIISFME